jgi:predicted metal-dependent hydrolase
MRSSNSPTKVEQRAALLAGRAVSYTLKRSKRRTIGLQVDDKGLTVSMPLRATEKWLNSVLQEKAHWVVEKLDGWQTRKPPEIRWENGGTVNYLGKPLTLQVTTGQKSSVKLQDNELIVIIRGEADVESIRKAVTRWYQGDALTLFRSRVAHFSGLLKVEPGVVKLSSAKKRWGSCTSSGTVRLNLQLIKLPMPLIDYVVVHELAHLREMNHSPAFWQVVASVCPEYAKLRRELKAMLL